MQQCHATTPAPSRRKTSRTHFGLLTLGERTEQRASSGELLYKCRCACGGETLATLRALRRGKKKSCGCLRAGQSAPVIIRDAQTWPVNGVPVPVTMIAAVLQRRPEDMQHYLAESARRGIPVERALRPMIH